MLVYPEGAVMVEAVVKDLGGMILDGGAEWLQSQGIEPVCSLAASPDDNVLVGR